MKLYQSGTSGNSHKVRLLCAMLGLDYESVAVDLRAGEQNEPWFRALNPRGQVPVLEDDGRVIWDSAAILVYLARKAGAEGWLPTEPGPMAEVMQWLVFAAHELRWGPHQVRRIKKAGRPGDLDTALQATEAALAILEARLAAHDWLATGRPTIADIACVPYIVLAPDLGIPLEPWPAVTAWVDRIRALPGYVSIESS